MPKVNKLFSVLLIVLLFTTALAASAWGEVRPIRDAMQSGGDRLVALQNADGGWFFVVGNTGCGLGPGVSCPNLFGVTALGLAASFNTVHDQGHLAAALLTGDMLVAQHAAAPPCDGNPATAADRPFSLDVTFLLDGLGRLGGKQKKAYRSVARAWFLCIMADFPSGASRAENRINLRIAQGRDNLGAWDASLDIRAAVAVGERDYALAEARQVIIRQSNWDVADPQCPGCELLAKGLYLAATHTLQDDPDIRDARERWRDELLAVQSSDGSWGGDTQVTAYIVMGLEAMSEGQGTHEATERAVEFLLSMQLPNGGFAVGVGFSDEVTATTAEVLQALAAH